MDVIKNLIEGNIENHLMPFLWIRGEDHAIYRNMVDAIYRANINAFCVEARPHKNFARQQWWDDLRFILTEAEKYNMRVWVLDDEHFPTGYANGGVLKAPVELHRQHLCHRQIKVKGDRTIRLNINKYVAPINKYSAVAKALMMFESKGKLNKKYKDDELISCIAYSNKENIDLMPFINKGRLGWEAPRGEWAIEICSLSRNTGMHRKYINMIDKQSCQIQIDEVYEPHYREFKEQFGTTFAGFFSDEPELGNGDYTKHYNELGTEQSLPYSRELAKELGEKLGKEWKNKLPLLWTNDYDSKETARIRYIYMDCITRLVEKNFSQQIGEWCNEHGVEYIGHIIEDNGQHARTSTSLGHYFRGLKYQNMAGIDVVSGQILPDNQDKTTRFILGYDNDGEFYHYELAKLGTSLGALNPRMKGRTLCEIFGNYGWSEGVRLEKYLVDHFMVRGVNHFVPHAFNSKSYPDKDCPPHFYAHGNNPQYRHFGTLMQYTNRVCNLISGGQIDTPVGILYHAEAEWSGRYMSDQKPARILWDHQVDFNIIPGDVFSEVDFYKTEIGKELVINERHHKLLLIPYSQFITEEVADGIGALLENGCKVAFIDEIPEGICNGKELPVYINQCDIVTLGNLVKYVETLGLRTIKITPVCERLRCMHYLAETELFYFFNEDDACYKGEITLPVTGALCEYDAWNNQLVHIDHRQNKENESKVQISLEPYKSLIIVCGKEKISNKRKVSNINDKCLNLNTFTQSTCRSIDYPTFSGHKRIEVLEDYAKTDKKFSGFIRYETTFTLDAFEDVVLEITDAYEGVEVFVNGKSAGIQIIPAYIFDIGELCILGKNELAIEVATTLERERGNQKNAAPTGITGEVNLYIQ